MTPGGRIEARHTDGHGQKHIPPPSAGDIKELAEYMG